MALVVIFDETHACSVRGFPKMLWEALVRVGGTDRQEYTVYRQSAPGARDEFWAKVIVFNARGLESQNYIVTGMRTRNPERAIQLAAYMTLTQLCHDMEELQLLRGTGYLPRHSVNNSYREYPPTNEEREFRDAAQEDPEE